MISVEEPDIPFSVGPMEWVLLPRELSGVLDGKINI